MIQAEIIEAAHSAFSRMNDARGRTFETALEQAVAAKYKGAKSAESRETPPSVADVADVANLSEKMSNLSL